MDIIGEILWYPLLLLSLFNNATLQIFEYEKTFINLAYFHHHDSSFHKRCTNVLCSIGYSHETSRIFLWIIHFALKFGAHLNVPPPLLRIFPSFFPFSRRFSLFRERKKFLGEFPEEEEENSKMGKFYSLESIPWKHVQHLSPPQRIFITANSSAIDRRKFSTSGKETSSRRETFSFEVGVEKRRIDSFLGRRRLLSRGDTVENGQKEFRTNSDSEIPFPRLPSLDELRFE